MLLIGKTTDAHHQIEMVCETCHAAPPFADAAAAEKALNGTCRNCHEDELEAADDSHPGKIFRNPRMAVFRDKLDARLCTSCHVEHHPEITRASTVTVAMDFCAACHSEGDQDVRQIRPSHVGRTFDTCADCHNYHDNRALHEDFLIKYAGGPWLAQSPIHPLAIQFLSRQRPRDRGLGRHDAVAPANVLVDPEVLDNWIGSGHAAAGVNCTACHADGLAADAELADMTTHWVDAPSTNVCRDCHETQAKTFAEGRHGMRSHPRIAKPRDPRRGLETVGLSDVIPEAIVNWLADPTPPTRMTVGEARLSMRSDADPHQALDCGTCHRPHDVDVTHAVVEACASCHDDPHTRAYFTSPHHQLWQAELEGTALPGTGVTCATCHMPRTERRGVISTDHNQNDTLRPNEKMIRPVCLHCHGLSFSLDALADVGLIELNFDGSPTVHVESIDWAVQRAAAREQDTGR